MFCSRNVKRARVSRAKGSAQISLSENSQLRLRVKINNQAICLTPQVESIKLGPTDSDHCIMMSAERLFKDISTTVSVFTIKAKVVQLSVMLGRPIHRQRNTHKPQTIVLISLKEHFDVP